MRSMIVILMSLASIGAVQAEPIRYCNPPPPMCQPFAPVIVTWCEPTPLTVYNFPPPPVVWVEVTPSPVIQSPAPVDGGWTYATQPAAGIGLAASGAPLATASALAPYGVVSRSATVVSGGNVTGTGMIPVPAVGSDAITGIYLAENEQQFGGIGGGIIPLLAASSPERTDSSLQRGEFVWRNQFISQNGSGSGSSQVSVGERWLGGHLVPTVPPAATPEPVTLFSVAVLGATAFGAHRLRRWRRKQNEAA